MMVLIRVVASLKQGLYSCVHVVELSLELREMFTLFRRYLHVSKDLLVQRVESVVNGFEFLTVIIDLFLKGLEFGIVRVLVIMVCGPCCI